MTERLLDHEAREAVAAIEARRAERLNGRRERLRRQGEIEHPVARQAVLTLQRGDVLRDAREIGSRAVADGLVVDLILVERRERFPRNRPERRIVGMRVPRDAEHDERRRQLAARLERAQGRKQLAAGEVAGGPDDDEQQRRRRFRDHASFLMAWPPNSLRSAASIRYA